MTSTLAITALIVFVLRSFSKAIKVLKDDHEALDL